MGVFGWRQMMDERSRRRVVERLPRAKPLDETRRRITVLETLRQWGSITEEEYLEERHALADSGAPSNRTW